MFEFISGYSDNYELDLVLVLNFWSLTPFSPFLVYLLNINHRYHDIREDYKGFAIYLLYTICNFVLFQTQDKFTAFLFFIPFDLGLFTHTMFYYRSFISGITSAVYCYHLFIKRDNSILDGSTLFLKKGKSIKIRYPIYFCYIIGMATIFSLFLGRRYILDYLPFLPIYFIWILMSFQFLFMVILIYVLAKNIELEIENENKCLFFESKIKNQVCHGEKIYKSDYISDISSYLISGTIIAYIYLNIILLCLAFLCLYEPIRKELIYFLSSFILVKCLNMLKTMLSFCVERCFKPEIFVLYDTFCFLSGINFIFCFQEMIDRVFYIILSAPLLSLNFSFYNHPSYTKAYYGYHKFNENYWV